MKRFTQHVYSTRGFGLVEVMVASAIVSVIGLGIASVLVDMQKGQKHIQQLNSAVDLTQTINALLADPAVCRRNFGSLAAAPTTQRSFGATVINSDLVNSSGGVVFDVASAAKYGDGQFNVVSYTLTQTSEINSALPLHVLGNLTLTFQKANPSSSSGPQTLSRSIAIEANLTGGTGSAINLCHTLGATDDALWGLSPDGESIHNLTTGNVGIGITDPTYPLQVSGSGPTQYGASPQIYANGDNHIGGGIRVSDDGGFFDYNDSWITYNGFSGLKIAGNNGPASANGVLAVMGRVGVGTTQPTYPLELTGSGPALHGGTAQIMANADDHFGGGVRVSNDGGFYDFNDGWITYSGNRGLLVAGTTGSGSTDGNLNVMGRVGIGTTAPVGAMTVVGNTALAAGSCIGFNRNPDDGSLPPNGIASNARFQLTPRNNRLDFEAFSTTGVPAGGLALMATGRVGIGSITPPERLFVDGNVGVSSGNGFVYMSDKRLKKNFIPLDGLKIIEHLSGYFFNWKKDGTKDVGVIAQEVESVLPEAVHTREDGTKSVDYPKLVAPLIEAVKEQQSQIRQLRLEIEELKAQQALETRK